MSFFEKENFGTDPTTGAIGLKVQVNLAGSGEHPVDPVTGKKLSGLQCEAAKETSDKNIRVVVTS